MNNINIRCIYGTAWKGSSSLNSLTLPKTSFGPLQNVPLDPPLGPDCGFKDVRGHIPVASLDTAMNDTD